jgi:hypothetical protein
MAVMGTVKFQRFFHTVASLDVDKDDLKRYSDFVDQKLYDLLLVAQTNAGANRRDVIEPHDLPITKGLQQSIYEFDNVDEEFELQPILESLAGRRPADMAYDVETESRLPRVAGGLSVAVARSFKIIDPDLRNPSSRHWERAFHLFDLLM